MLSAAKRSSKTKQQHDNLRKQTTATIQTNGCYNPSKQLALIIVYAVGTTYVMLKRVEFVGNVS